MALRRLCRALLPVAAALLLVPSGAAATPWPTSWVSPGNAPEDAFWSGQSPDGRQQFFTTAEALLPTDLNGAQDLYMWEDGQLSLPLPAASAPVSAAYVSKDGTHIAFTTDSGLAPGDTDGTTDVYETTLGGGTVWISNGGNGFFGVGAVAIAPDGLRVYFETPEQQAGGDVDAAPDVYSGNGGAPTLVSGAGAAPATLAFSNAGVPAVSADGTRVVIETSSQLTAGDTDANVDVYRSTGGTLALLSASNGAFDATYVASSQDLSVVFFATSEAIDPGDVGGQDDVYRWAGGAPVLATGTGPSIENFGESSSDGTHFFFNNPDQLAPQDQNGSFDIYDYDATLATDVLMSSGGALADDVSQGPATRDGRFVYWGTADALVPADSDATNDTYVTDVATRTISLATPGTSTSASGLAVNDSGSRLFVYSSEALSAADTDTATDVYVFENGQPDLVSTGPSGSVLQVSFTAITDDGSVAVLNDTAPLDAADTDGFPDVYIARAPASPPAPGGGGSTPTPTPIVTDAAAPTAAPSTVPPPQEAKSFNIKPLSGKVLAKLPGTSTFVVISDLSSIPNGTIIDARKGKVRLYTTDGNGGIQFADFYEGMFKVTQQKDGWVTLELVGGDFKKCPRAQRATAAVALGKPVRHLWGSGEGKFRTKGGYASAGLRGTTWLTDDRCNGTLVRVTAGAVTVRDFVRRKSVALKAPKTYFAAAPKKRR